MVSGHQITLIFLNYRQIFRESYILTLSNSMPSYKQAYSILETTLWRDKYAILF